jgi:uncharacterized protein YgfB (UPF0149 family)
VILLSYQFIIRVKKGLGKMHKGISIQSHLNNTLAYSKVETKDESIKEIINKVNSINLTVQEHQNIALDFHKNIEHKTTEEIKEYIMNIALLLHDISNEL